MPLEDKDLSPVREQTDESLRAEREKTDQALAEQLAATDEIADEVISRARDRADELRAGVRARTDQHGAGPIPPSKIEKERSVEDLAMQIERDAADEVVRVERATQLAMLAAERAETDKDLLVERARADAAIAMRDEFLAIVSHDLRNLLGVMLGATSVIAIDVGNDPQGAALRAHLQRILRAGARMNRLIGDLVDVASIEAGLLAVTSDVGDPTSVVTEAVESFQTRAAATGVTLTAEIAPAPLEAAFDPSRILQVLTNLLSNALKFTPAGGHVVVRVEPGDGEVRFAVVDDGVGIPKDKLEAIFERFMQINPQDRRGAGLGLYISKCIVEAHGGQIWAESTPGRGSTFTFTLPRKSAGT